MEPILMMVLLVAAIAVMLLIADAVLRHFGVDSTVRWLVLLIVLIVLLLLLWPRFGLI